MAHFAHITENSVVDQVIVAEQDFIDSGAVGDFSEWVQTSYNTVEGKHLLGGTPLRKNFAGIGYTYDSNRDAFIPPSPYPSWVLDEEKCIWGAPVPHPADGGYYRWDEQSLTWMPQPRPNLIY